MSALFLCRSLLLLQEQCPGMGVEDAKCHGNRVDGSPETESAPKLEKCVELCQLPSIHQGQTHAGRRMSVIYKSISARKEEPLLGLRIDTSTRLQVTYLVCYVQRGKHSCLTIRRLQEPRSYAQLGSVGGASGREVRASSSSGTWSEYLAN